MAALAPHRVQEPRLLRDGGRGGQRQRRALGAKPAEIGRVIRVAAHAGDLLTG